jgi:polysaccharide pyruvyl transferase WcaK-like protein
MLGILHAFSRKNAGDGLLVDITLALVEKAGFDPASCRILALDAESFRDLPRVAQVPGEPRGKPSWRAVGAGFELLRACGGGGRIANLVKDCRGLLAVGGGYLVADSVVRSAGVLLNHLPQILAAGRAGIPSIYLPQSIGPLQGPVGEITRRALSRIDVLYVRDDETLQELGSITEVRRCPDLAVLRLAESLGSIQVPCGQQTGPTILVARELPRAPHYTGNLQRLGAMVASPLWAVQVDVDGPRSDRRFLRALDAPDAGDLSALLTLHTPGVVVSVRLHGAISSLLEGWPAIHLAYERKGRGAYEDLGIPEYVHDARSFDPAKVRAQVEALRENPASLFDRIEKRRPALLEAYRLLVDDVAKRLR